MMFDKSGPLWKAFLEFHQANPWVYARLREICWNLRGKGFRKYSTRTIIAVLRFEMDMKTGGEAVTLRGGEKRKLKLNDHHSAYYARLLIEEDATWAQFFELRAAEGDCA